MQQIVHAHVAHDGAAAREGVVANALDVGNDETGLAAGARQFRRTDELFVVMGAFRQDVQQKLRADDGQRERLGGAIDGGQEDVAAGFH